MWSPPVKYLAFNRNRNDGASNRNSGIGGDVEVLHTPMTVFDTISLW